MQSESNASNSRRELASAGWRDSDAGDISIATTGLLSRRCASAARARHAELNQPPPQTRPARRGIHQHSRMPKKYSPISGIIISIMLYGSLGVNSIARKAITSTDIRQLARYDATVKMPIRSKNSITSGN